MRIKIGAALVAILALSTAVAGCGDDGSSAEAEAEGNYEVIAFLGVTGPAGSQINTEVQGLRAHAAYLNERGGIDGRQVDVEVVDTAGDATRAVSLLTEKLSGDPPDLVIAGGSSNETLAMLPTLTREKILSTAPTGAVSINDPAKYPYHFAVSIDKKSEYAALAKFISDEGAKKPGLITTDDALGQAWTAGVTAELTALGITATSQLFPVGTTDITPQFERLRATKPDLVVMDAFGATAGYLLSSFKRIGWDVPLVGGTALGSNDLIALTKGDVPANLRMQIPSIQEYVDPNAMTPTRKTFFDEAKKLGPIENTINLAGIGWDWLTIVSVAAEQAGSTETEDLSAALTALKVSDPSPFVYVTKTSYSAQSHFIVAQPDDFRYVAPAPVVDGMFKAGS